MRRNNVRSLLIGGVLVATAACAAGEEWGTWKAHPTHFAIADHLIFSAWDNQDPSSPRVNREDIATAREEHWRGKPGAVSQDQIIEP